MWGSYSSRSSIVHSYLSRSAYVAKRSTAWDARSPYGMGWRITTTFFPCSRRMWATRRVVWLFPLPVRHAQVRLVRADEAGELLLRVDRDALRVEGPREGRGVPPALDARDLSRGEGDDLVLLVVPEVDVEVVEVAARGAEDDHASRLCHAVGNPGPALSFFSLRDASFGYVRSSFPARGRSPGTSARTRARRTTSSSIASRRRPVEVFRWLGW